MEIIIYALKVIGLFAGSVVVAVNLELFLLRIAAWLRLGNYYEKSAYATLTEIIVFVLTIAGIILSFWLVGIAYNYFGVGGRVWTLTVYMLFDLKTSFVDLLGLGKNTFSKKCIIYDDEMYPVVVGRIAGFIAAFILLIFKVV